MWECGLCLCIVFFFGKIDYDIKKQQFLGEENIFSSTLVQYIIIIFFCLFAFLWSTFIPIQKFTNTTLICCCFFVIIVIALRRKNIAIFFSFVLSLTFYMEIITLFCVNLFFSLMFSTLLQRKLTTWNTCLLCCVCFSFKYI